MGRTLHYNIKKDKGSFTGSELAIMFEISERYNSNELLKDINTAYGSDLKELWTCESFWLGIGSFYPNWKTFENSDINNPWEFINKKIEELEKTMSFIDAVFHMKKEGHILFYDENYKNEFHGFTKVQGNEFNSLLVYKALIEISKRIPKATLTVRDEGGVLFCPLTIKNGLVLPDVAKLVDKIQYYSMLMMLSKNYKNNILSSLKNTTFENKCFKRDLHIENGYGDMSNHIDKELLNLQETEKVLMKYVEKESDLFIYNLNKRHPKKWFKPELFMRAVDVEKFLKYKLSPDTLMDGFYGEGFGLCDGDDEVKKNELLFTFFKMLEGLGYDKNNTKILGS